MASLFRNTVFAFHGCDRVVGNRLLAGEEFSWSRKEHNWLGPGVYFWENDPARAIRWALDRRHALRQRSKGKEVSFEPFAVGVTLNLGHCLDLLTQDGIWVLEQALEMERKETPAKIRTHNHADNDILRYGDNSLIKSAHELVEEAGPFDTVRGCFEQGEPIMERSGIRRQSYIQICLRNRDSVLNVFRIRPEMVADDELYKQVRW